MEPPRQTPSSDIQCEPLTPVWTGDASSQGGRTRETGLIGSLRWWYEAILRGCGFYACDPSSGTCVYEDDRRLAGICLACQLFGCTGYSRRFRLEVEGGGGAGELLPIRLKNPGVANHRGWRVPKFLTKPFILKILPLYPKSMDTEGLSLTLGLIERFGAFGAKTSHGQGAVRFENLPARRSIAEWIDCLAKAHDGSTGELHQGYWLCDVTAAEVNGSEIVPLYQKLYSAEAKDFRSENDEVLAAVDLIRSHTQG
ncbi:MAG TPA: type III-B CRISPR module RAMP protein Cmr1, partial [Bryobacteraceae bacterium]|nr:type III-B CRISPR module RAMP protein Cmr1 [Bryobacteraceae bacterium]